MIIFKPKPEDQLRAERDTLLWALGIDPNTTASDSLRVSRSGHGDSELTTVEWDEIYEDDGRILRRPHGIRVETYREDDGAHPMTNQTSTTEGDQG